jgi:hypothetical protein
MNEKRQRGKFTLTGELIREADMKLLRKIMENVVVFHIEARFDMDQSTYFAHHPDFEEIGPGVEYPEYTAVLSYVGKKLDSVEWRKV